ncbi:hypothetical protein CDO52_26795 [Nocardiopsis gilva YIM 90087]|uniref:Thioredoxin domain-containing protein n=1 Tax=Nocardiopsis gilva YIM 90087 TaxID=1235441 RepID=A0A223SCW7_9ACTN|nr:deiodinase-like protein [Nocardiopsis gilva]ASU85926.1 hypothetical protein CDO52_26795 [Nocardiopsis gilva YIM 90087]
MQETGPESDPAAYNYAHFSLAHRTMDMLGGVRVGDPLPDFTATRLDGAEVRARDYLGTPIVLETGSVTCPMYVGRVQPMNALAYRYPEAEFLVLYTREAHPGARIGAHRTAAQKAAGARVVAEHDRESRTILIDDLQGSAHRQLGAMPNTVHVIAPDGTIAYRSIWNDPETVEQVVRDLLRGKAPAQHPARFRPAGLPTLLRVLRRAGRGALRDFAKEAPKIAWLHLRPSRSGQALFRWPKRKGKP